MALSQLDPVSPGDRIESVTWNSEFQNILTHPVDLISPSTGPINFNLQAHTNLVPTAITATSGSAGQVLSIGFGGTPIWSAGQASPSRVMGLLGAVSSQSGTFSADAYVMRSTLGTQSWTVSATSSYSASVGTAGPAAGGRDIAGAFASTYVHWYAISTGAGSTAPAALVSTNPPNIGPVAMPTSYSGWAYLGGSIYSSASTTLVTDHHFRGSWASYDAQVAVLSGGTSTTQASVALGTALPGNASRMQLVAEFSIQSTAAGGSLAALALRVVSGSDFLRMKQQAPASQTIFNTLTAELPNLSQTLFYILDSQLSSGNIVAQSANIWCQGYQNPGVA